LEGARDSNLYIQLHMTARFLVTLGRIDEAAAVAQYVVDRDPACTPCVDSLSYVLRSSGKHREAAESLEALSEWRELRPTHFWNLGVSWLVAGEPMKALEYFKKAPPGNHEIGQLLAYYDLGRMDEFETGFSAMLNDPEKHPEGIARVAAWSRQNDLAFEYLERAMALQGPGYIQSIKRGSDLYQRIQSDPRWQAFFDQYDTAEEDDLSGIRFNPKLPQEVVEALARS
jgi:tetratricopeptide (TPR) repeat protein